MAQLVRREDVNGWMDVREKQFAMTNQDSGDVQQKHEQTIADYVGDMVALESHIEEALDRQLTETQDDPEARAGVQRFHDMVKQHRDTLKALQEQVGTTAGNPIIAAGSTLLGKAAGVVDLVRTEGISKSLRDDYAAFSLAAISYSMLHTTSLGSGQPAGGRAGRAASDRLCRSHRAHQRDHARRGRARTGQGWAPDQQRSGGRDPNDGGQSLACR